MVQIKNMDIAEVYRNLNKFVIEVHDDGSSNLNETSVHLITRMNGYIDYLMEANRKMSAVVTHEIVETGSRFYTLPDPTYASEIINNCNKTCCTLLEIIRDEIVNYQSVDYAFGLMLWDRPRNLNLIKNLKGYVDSISNLKILDLPKTSKPLVAPKVAPVVAK
jgi:hypothetical protein